MHAHLFQNYKKVNAPNTLQIDSKNVVFFIPPIRDTSAFCSSDNGQDWQLKFFIGSAFERELTVYFDAEEGQSKYRVGKACWLDNQGNRANDAQLIGNASTFLRQANTLDQSHSKQLTSNGSLLADRNGIAYFSNNNAQFLRIVLCQALGIAYANVLSECMSSMTDNVKNNRTEKTLELYDNILRFNAAHYFRLPVLRDRHELFAAWQIIAEHYQIDVLNQELTQQLSGVAALLKEQRERQRTADEQRANKKDKWLTYLLSLVGIFLTATSLLSLFQLTPTQFFDNAHAWKNWLSQPAKQTATSKLSR